MCSLDFAKHASLIEEILVFRIGANTKILELEVESVGNVEKFRKNKCRSPEFT